MATNKVNLDKDIVLIKKTNSNKIGELRKFPQYKIEGGSGFETVKIILQPKQSIRSNGGTMNFMTSNIIDSVKTRNKNNSFTKSFGSIVGRAFTGSSLFYNIFENIGENMGYLSLSTNIPGNVGTFYIPRGRELNIVSDSYICSTTNLDVTGSVKLGGILLGYGLVFINIKLKESDTHGNNGLVWVGSLGHIFEHKLAPGEKVIVNNGVLLAFDSKVDINTYVVQGKNTGSTFKTFLFSGEGLISEVKNNTSETRTVYLQSRSKIFYNDYIKAVCNAEIDKKSSSQGDFFSYAFS